MVMQFIEQEESMFNFINFLWFCFECIVVDPDMNPVPGTDWRFWWTKIEEKNTAEK